MIFRRAPRPGSRTARGPCTRPRRQPRTPRPRPPPPSPQETPLSWAAADATQGIYQGDLSQTLEQLYNE